jgi:hypothetical protein
MDTNKMFYTYYDAKACDELREDINVSHRFDITIDKTYVLKVRILEEDHKPKVVLETEPSTLSRMDDHIPLTSILIKASTHLTPEYISRVLNNQFHAHKIKEKENV